MAPTTANVRGIFLSEISYKFLENLHFALHFLASRVIKPHDSA